MKKVNWKTISLAIGAVSFASALAGSFAVQEVFDAIFTNKDTKLSRLLFKDSGEHPVREEYRDWVKAQPQRVVRTRSVDGLRLTCHCLMNPEAKRNMILVHGWHGNWLRDMAMHARYFYEAGCNVWIPEMRAQGSEGRCMTMGILEAEDCRKWIDVVMADNTLPIFLYGISMGGSTLGILAGKDLPLKVRGLVIDCGFTAPAEILREAGDKMNPWIMKLFLRPLDARMKMLSGVSLYSAAAKVNIRMAKIPVLFIHGTADDFVPTGMGEELYKACDARKKLILVQNAGHCMSFVREPENIMEQTSRFFRWN